MFRRASAGSCSVDLAGAAGSADHRRLVGHRARDRARAARGGLRADARRERAEKRSSAAAAELGAHARPRRARARGRLRSASSRSTRRASGGSTCSSNSAGIGICERLEQTKVEHLDRTLAVNLRAVVLVTQAALPLLRRSTRLDRHARVARGGRAEPDLPGLCARRRRRHLADALDQRRRGGGRRARVRDRAGHRRHADGRVDRPGDREKLLRPEDCAEVVRLLLRLGPRARDPARSSCERDTRARARRASGRSSRACRARAPRRARSRSSASDSFVRAISADEISRPTTMIAAPKRFAVERSDVLELVEARRARSRPSASRARARSTTWPTRRGSRSSGSTCV